LLRDSPIDKKTLPWEGRGGQGLVTIIPNRQTAVRTHYRRNKAALLAKAQKRRENRRGGPRMCSRCGLSPAASSRHHHCERCKAIAQATHPRSRFPTPQGSAADRGYDPLHAKQRARWAKIVAAGDGYCARCGGHIAPGSDWHLDHRDDRDGYIGPSHARCNISAGARNGNVRRSLAQPPMEPHDHSRVWL
jgi:hypothetical protein